MFDRLAGRYDLFNHFTSFGLAGRWRALALGPLRAGMRVLDLGCGTGDLCLGAARRVGVSGEVVGLDFSEAMLAVARRRLEKERPVARVSFVREKAESLPIEEDPYDMVVSAFVLRNLYENTRPILSGVLRSLKEGGGVSFVDMTEPENAWWRFCWRAYMNSVPALYGRALFGKDYPSSYITDSAKRFLRAAKFAKLLEEMGFKNVRVRSFMGGMVSLYQAVK
ncbi:MAG: ubiquinone/menaquinone biosynthesis methyltransferase [Candidatus Omnitrophica bacterium]|nr:ubiquinone/menaquinone biosynthesis methyltransferase [Candidatus Omnitrophota bacterium]